MGCGGVHNVLLPIPGMKQSGDNAFRRALDMRDIKSEIIHRHAKMANGLFMYLNTILTMSRQYCAVDRAPSMRASSTSSLLTIGGLGRFAFATVLLEGEVTTEACFVPLRRFLAPEPVEFRLCELPALVERCRDVLSESETSSQSLVILSCSVMLSRSLNRMREENIPGM